MVTRQPTTPATTNANHPDKQLHLRRFDAASVTDDGRRMDDAELLRRLAVTLHDIATALDTPDSHGLGIPPHPPPCTTCVQLARQSRGLHDRCAGAQHVADDLMRTVKQNLDIVRDHAAANLGNGLMDDVEVWCIEAVENDIALWRDAQP